MIAKKRSSKAAHEQETKLGSFGSMRLTHGQEPRREKNFGSVILMHGLKVGEKNPEAWPARQWRENTTLTLQEL